MFSVFKTIRIWAGGFEDPKTQGHMVPFGKHINLLYEKGKELLGLIKKFVKHRNLVRYFALM